LLSRKKERKKKGKQARKKEDEGKNHRLIEYRHEKSKRKHSKRNK
jgi:hypothetical protein